MDAAAPPPADTLPITGRLLPPDEWADKLVGTSLEGKPLDPEQVLVAVAEQGGRVVRCVALLTVVHADGLWTAEDHEGEAGSARALIEVLVEALVTRGVREVLALSQPATDPLYEHAGGQRLPGTLWVIPVVGGEGTVQ